jgi:hypothetical protein
MQSQEELSLAVEGVRRRLCEWRRSNKAPKPIPDDIWREAADLAQRFGVCRVRKILGLGYDRLKKNMPASRKPVTVAARTAPPAPVPAFLEWIAPPLSTVEHCSLELESPRGTKLRLEVKGLPVSGLTALMKELAV